MPWSSQSGSRQEPLNTATYTFLALGSTLVLVLTDNTVPRILGVAAVIAHLGGPAEPAPAGLGKSGKR